VQGGIPKRRNCPLQVSILDLWQMLQDAVDPLVQAQPRPPVLFGDLQDSRKEVTWIEIARSQWIPLKHFQRQRNEPRQPDSLADHDPEIFDSETADWLLAKTMTGNY
jgi:hypothetical protein